MATMETIETIEIIKTIETIATIEPNTSLPPTTSSLQMYKNQPYSFANTTKIA